MVFSLVLPLEISTKKQIKKRVVVNVWEFPWSPIILASKCLERERERVSVCVCVCGFLFIYLFIYKSGGEWVGETQVVGCIMLLYCFSLTHKAFFSPRTLTNNILNKVVYTHTREWIVIYHPRNKTVLVIFFFFFTEYHNNQSDSSITFCSVIVIFTLISK